MCEKCESRFHVAGEGGVRPCPATDLELALLAKARRTKDPKKLAAMMPAWIRAELAKPMPKPWVFVPDKKPVLPRMLTPFTAPKLKIPNMSFNDKPIAEFVAEFDSLNGLMPIPLAVPAMPIEERMAA